MATEQSTDIWSVLELVATGLGGVWAGVRAASGWFSKREAAMSTAITKVQTNMDKEVAVIRERLHKHGNDVAANTLAIAVIQTQHGAVTERLSKIERCVEKVNDKQDEQTELLLKIYNGHGK